MYLHLICFALPRGKAKRAVRGMAGRADVRAADTVGSHERAFLHNLRRRRRRRHRRSSTAALLFLLLFLCSVSVSIYAQVQAYACVCILTYLKTCQQC